MTTYLFVSDIHSNIKTLKELEHKVPEWNDPNTHIVFCGDYIDGFIQKADEGLEVLKFVKNLYDSGKASALLGNHDDWLKDVLLLKNNTLLNWFQCGGQTTWAAWQKALYTNNNQDDSTKIKVNYHNPRPITSASDIYKLVLDLDYEDIIDWFVQLPLSLSFGQILAVHAGFDLTKPLMKQDDDTRLWVRDSYFIDQIDAYEVHDNFINKTVVSGHTPNQCLSNSPICSTTNHGEVISIIKDGFPDRYLIDAGSNGNPTRPCEQLNILLLNEDGSLIRSELIQSM
jgi:diadenosine tetraphosphatase related serine/threonine protein phosphatase